MAGVVRGFPDRFPVRDGDGRSLRYRISSLLAKGYLRLFFGRGLRIEGVENLPVDGPLLVVCNHLSNVDPLIFGGRFPLTLFAMAKRELYSNPLLAWWLAGCNCVPIERGAADRRAVTRALEILRHGGRLLVFLEGTRSAMATMQRAEPGAGFLARRSGALVQPVAIWGTEGAHTVRFPFPRRVRISMRYGTPFALRLDGRRDDAVIADEMAARVAQLLPPAYRGVYGTGLTDDG